MQQTIKIQEQQISPIPNNHKNWELEVKKLVESRRLNEAKQILKAIQQTEEENTALKYWQRVLEEAKIISKTPASGGYGPRNIEWLHKNAIEHQGQWIALRAGTLLGSNKSRMILRQQLKQSGQHHGAVFIKIGG